jgi:hypothetical protein
LKSPGTEKRHSRQRVPGNKAVFASPQNEKAPKVGAFFLWRPSGSTAKEYADPSHVARPQGAHPLFVANQ